MTCVCGLVTDTISLCPEHHRYHLGGRQLAGVTSVIKETLGTSYEGVDESVLENARDRGNQVDALITAYVMGKLTEYPIGTRHDAKDLFEKFQTWWDKQRFKNVSAQAVVHDEEIAGAIDLKADGAIFDVKCTSALMPAHRIQVAGYLELDSHAEGGALIHLTKRYKTPRFEPITMSDQADWDVVRDFWRLKRRLS